MQQHNNNQHSNAPTTMMMPQHQAEQQPRVFEYNPMAYLPGGAQPASHAHVVASGAAALSPNARQRQQRPQQQQRVPLGQKRATPARPSLALDAGGVQGRTPSAHAPPLRAAPMLPPVVGTAGGATPLHGRAALEGTVRRPPVKSLSAPDVHSINDDDDDGAIHFSGRKTGGPRHAAVASRQQQQQQQRLNDDGSDAGPPASTSSLNGSSNFAMRSSYAINSQVRRARCSITFDDLAEFAENQVITMAQAGELWRMFASSESENGGDDGGYEMGADVRDRFADDEMMMAMADGEDPPYGGELRHCAEDDASLLLHDSPPRQLDPALFDVMARYGGGGGGGQNVAHGGAVSSTTSSQHTTPAHFRPSPSGDVVRASPHSNRSGRSDDDAAAAAATTTIWANPPPLHAPPPSQTAHRVTALSRDARAGAGIPPTTPPVSTIETYDTPMTEEPLTANALMRTSSRMRDDDDGDGEDDDVDGEGEEAGDDESDVSRDHSARAPPPKEPSPHRGAVRSAVNPAPRRVDEDVDDDERDDGDGDAEEEEADEEDADADGEAEEEQDTDDASSEASDRNYYKSLKQ